MKTYKMTSTNQNSYLKWALTYVVDHVGINTSETIVSEIKFIQGCITKGAIFNSRQIIMAEIQILQ